MILVDHQIRKLCEEGLVTPFDPKLINPASLDVRIGDSAIVEYMFGDKPESSKLNLAQYSKEAPYWLQPKEFILLSTLEIFNFPENIVGEFKMTSSRAREGITNCLAGFIDPGFYGSSITLEVTNECRYTPRPIYPGLIIGQVVFYSCLAIPERSYRVTGRYNNCPKVTASKG